MNSNFMFTSTKSLLKYIIADKKPTTEELYSYVDEISYRAQDNNSEIEFIISYIVKQLNKRSEKWKKIFKGLKLLELLLKELTMNFYYQMRYHLELIDNLRNFKYEVNGAENIREKAKTIYDLLNNDGLITEERKKYKEFRARKLNDDKKMEGGLLNSIGSFKLEEKNNKNKYDLTRNDEDEEESSEDEKNPKIKTKGNIQREKQNLISFDDNLTESISNPKKDNSTENKSTQNQMFNLNDIFSQNNSNNFNTSNTASNNLFNNFDFNVSPQNQNIPKANENQSQNNNLLSFDLNSPWSQTETNKTNTQKVDLDLFDFNISGTENNSTNNKMDLGIKINDNKNTNGNIGQGLSNNLNQINNTQSNVQTESINLLEF
ncbi:MAG: hypothetical protein MJ252_00905 [archaeon]|nr:hypothetical protein [archaeon]